MPVTDIERELRDATKLKVKVGEKRQAFLGRLQEAVSGLPDGGWDKISQSGQKWANDAQTAVNDKKPIPEFVSDAAETPMKKGGAKAAKGGKTSAPKPAKDDAKPTGIKIALKKIMLKKPTIDADSLFEALQKQGFDPSPDTVRAIRSEFRHSLKVLKSEGLVDIDV